VGGVAESQILVDDPAPRVRRLTLNRPSKRNALSRGLLARLFDELRWADLAAEVSVIVIRGAGSCFSAGYDLAQDPTEPLVRHASPADGYWPRHVVDGWFEMWDYATPIVAQVHGFCLAGGSELATASDLVYVAEDAVIGYPPVRLMSPPDMAWQPWGRHRLAGARVPSAVKPPIHGDARRRRDRGADRA
jgi:enoyl-CoA hydratase